jgi:hypothetical protein
MDSTRRLSAGYGGSMEQPVIDKNDKALVQYFLRGMRRFAKHVRAQDVFENADIATLQAHIEVTYRLACSQFATKENK